MRVETSARQTSAALRLEAHRDLRSRRHLDLGGSADHNLLSDIDDVIAVAAEIRLTAHNAGQYVIARYRGRRRQRLQVVRRHPNAHLRAACYKLAFSDLHLDGANLCGTLGLLSHLRLV